MLQDESEIIFSRRGFLRGVAGIAGVVGGKLLPNVPGFLPPNQQPFLKLKNLTLGKLKKERKLISCLKNRKMDHSDNLSAWKPLEKTV